MITLCGSTRFKEEVLAVQKQLTLEGNIVCRNYSVGDMIESDGLRKLFLSLQYGEIEG